MQAAPMCETPESDDIPTSEYVTASSSDGGSECTPDEASPPLPPPEDEDEEGGADPATIFKNRMCELQSLEYKVTNFEKEGYSDKPTLGLIHGHRAQAWKVKAEAEAAHVKLLADNVALSLARQAAGGSSHDASGDTNNKRKRGADDDDGREGQGSTESSVAGARKIIGFAEFYGPNGDIARHHAALRGLDTRVKAAVATRDNLELEVNILVSMGAPSNHLRSIVGQLHKLNADMAEVQKLAKGMCDNIVPASRSAKRA